MGIDVSYEIRLGFLPRSVWNKQTRIGPPSMPNFLTPPPPPPCPVGPPPIPWRSCKPMPWRVPLVGGSYRGSASKNPPTPSPPPPPHPLCRGGARKRLQLHTRSIFLFPRTGFGIQFVHCARKTSCTSPLWLLPSQGCSAQRLGSGFGHDYYSSHAPS